MADAKKCDRCGKYYDTSPKRNITFSNVQIRNSVGYSPLYKTVMNIAIVDDNRNFRSLDLCGTCLKEFGEFMNPGQPHTEDEV